EGGVLVGASVVDGVERSVGVEDGYGGRDSVGDPNGLARRQILDPAHRDHEPSSGTLYRNTQRDALYATSSRVARAIVKGSTPGLRTSRIELHHGQRCADRVASPVRGPRGDHP